MNDKKLIIGGLILFVLFFSFPFWFNHFKALDPPEVVLSQKAKAAKFCVEDKEYMKREHMVLLNTWRETVVREGKRVYVGSNGQHYNMSISSGENSCIGCHESKKQFCDACHNYASVSPYCWDCHLEPKEVN